MREVVAGSRAVRAPALALRVVVRALLPSALVAAAALWTPLADVDPRASPGGGRLQAWLLEGGAVRRLDDGALVAPGARVQLAYTVPAVEPRDPPPTWYAVVFSVDERGKRTLHFPRHPDARTSLERASGVLPTSFELDDAPGRERFYLVLGERPLSVARVLAAHITSNPSFSLRKATSTRKTRAPAGVPVR